MNWTMAMSSSSPAVRIEVSETMPLSAMTAEVDIVAPCALGGAISADSVGRIRASIVCGSANNQLADESLAARLADRGVLYAPDFIANAGGLISVYRDLKGYSRERALELAEGVEATLAGVFEPDAAAAESPKPYWHPLRALHGGLVTGYRPWDHRWHAPRHGDAR